jgi:hypothetical protein
MSAMKRVILLSTVLATLLATGSRGAHATEVGSRRNLGLGFAVGTPTSIVGKLFLDPYSAIDVGVGFWSHRGSCYYVDSAGRRRGCGWGRFHAVSLNADYLWQDNLARGTAKLDWHIGVGGRIWFFDDDYYEDDDEIALGARMPIGLDLTFDRPSFLEVFLELAPVLYLVPTDFDIEAMIGARFYF